MQKILKAGKYIKRPLQFTCSFCNCMFESDEYSYEEKFDDILMVRDLCPECSSLVSFTINSRLLR